MAHNQCNLRRRRQNSINIYCHNGSAFDFHFLVSKKLEDERITYLDGLPDSQERLRLLKLNEYVFKDSIKFLKNSLDALVKDMKVRNPNHEFKILAQSDICLSNKKKFDEAKFDMLKNGKSRLPYEKLTMRYLTETTEVPDKADYFSDLSEFFFIKENFKISLKLLNFIPGGTHIDDATYSDIKKFWKLFKCRNIADYSSYYVSLDTLLLAEVFMEFRRYMMSWSNLDPDHYLGLPSLAYDIFLYRSKTEIELLTDAEKMNFFEDGIRGGLSFASERRTDTRGSSKTMFHWVNLFYFFFVLKKILKYFLGCE